MIHESLQGYIVCEDCLGSCSSHTTVGASGMRGRWVKLRQQETSLRATSVTNNESRERETVGDQVL